MLINSHSSIELIEHEIDRLEKILKDRKAISTFQVGDIFKSPTSGYLVILAAYNYGYKKNPKCFYFGGLGNNPLQPYSNEMMSREEVIDFISQRNGEKVGHIALNIQQFIK